MLTFKALILLPVQLWVHHTLNASMYTRFTIFIKRKAWCKWICISKELEVTCSWQKGWCFCIFTFRHISYSGIPEYHIYKSKIHENWKKTCKQKTRVTCSYLFNLFVDVVAMAEFQRTRGASHHPTLKASDHLTICSLKLRMF